MLERNVMVDGKLYVEHELDSFTVVVGKSIAACVRSTASDPHETDEMGEPVQPETVDTYHELPYEDGITAARMESQLWALEAFGEYVDANPLLDEVLEILTDEQAATVPDAFREWKPNTEYAVGDRRRYAGVLYKCLQAHTSQADQTPDVAVSLWARILNPDPEVIPVWSQPDSTNPYMTGDRVHYPDADGPIYESTIDYNIYSPEAYPQGWQLVEGGE